MKAIILAGGQGSRLRPLTCDTPKPLIKIAGTPIAEYIIELLQKNGFDDIYFSLGYLHKEMTDFIESYSLKNKDVKISCFIEESPKGTAGCLFPMLGDNKKNEDVLVISGDCMCDIELDKVMKYHKSKQADVTIVCKQMDNTDEYGTVCLDSENFITGFCEKADRNHAVSSLANCGIYIVSDSVIRMTENRECCDFSKDIFPEMLNKNMKLAAYNTDSYWCDIGDLNEYRRCVRDFLDCDITTSKKSQADGIISYSDIGISTSVSFIPPVYIGSNIRIDDDCVIGPYTVIEDNAVIGKRTRIKNSIVNNTIHIDNDCDITGSIIARACIIHDNCTILENTCIGTGCSIGAHSVIDTGILLWPNKSIASGTHINDNIREGRNIRELISDGKISGKIFSELRSDICCKIGMSLGSVLKNKTVGIGFDGAYSSKALAMAIMSGLISTGCTVYNFGECYASLLQFCVSFSSAQTGIFVSSSSACAQIDFYDKFGLPLSREFERQIEARYRKSDFIYSDCGICSDSVDMSRINELYYAKLFALCSEFSGRVKYSYNSKNKFVSDVIDRCSFLFSSGFSDLPHFVIDEKGEKLSAKDENGISVEYEHLLILCALDEFRKGRSVCVKSDAPLMIDSMAEKYGCDVVRLSGSSVRPYSDREYRLSERCMFSFDAVFMMFKILSVMSSRSKKLSELVDEIPSVGFTRREITSDMTPSAIGRIFRVNKTDPVYGYRVYLSDGSALISSSPDGGRIKIFAESVSAEISNSICEEIEDKIKESSLDITQQIE